MSHIFWRDLRATYPTIVRGEGVYLYDNTGRRYLDGCSGALVTNIGHGVAEIADAMAAQARRVAFAHISNFVTEPALHLAALLAERAPQGLRSVYYASGGSEAVETALKLARAYFLERDGAGTPKHLIIGRWHGYHGNTLGALSASGHWPRRRPYEPLLLPFLHIEPCNAYRQPYGPDCADWDVRAARALEAAIVEAGPQRVAAFIAEPVVGAAAGAVAGTRAYFEEIRRICDRHDVLFIADEVMTGFGRTGRQFAIEHFGVTPDMLVMGKGMAAGYAPLAGVLVHDRIREVFARGSGRFVHGHTYSAHPVACAAGCAVQEYMDRHRLVSRAAALGPGVCQRLQVLRRWRIVGDVRGMGMMWGVEFVRDRATKEPFPRALRLVEQVVAETMRRGVMVYPGTGGVDGVNGDHLLVGPPLTISEAELDELVGALDEAVGAVTRAVLAGQS
ncbi:MAG: aspartate aminotransferase family protein [Armatimonadota bacterium]|nr:aspartate aminotransferase family protein [Armatimonadota bacterium]